MMPLLLSLKRKALSAALGLIVVAFPSGFAASCSIPSLEPEACTNARVRVREFYSFHFGNGLAFSQESLNERKKFLTPEFAARLANTPDGADPFTTGNTDFAKAFRVGSCTSPAADQARFQVLIFWRDETRTEQREIEADAVKRGSEWFVDNVVTKSK